MKRESEKTLSLVPACSSYGLKYKLKTYIKISLCLRMPQFNLTRAMLAFAVRRKQKIARFEYASTLRSKELIQSIDIKIFLYFYEIMVHCSEF